MIVSTAKMTARQFLQLGEDPPGVKLELVDGEIAVSPSPIPAHSYALLRLTLILGNHIDAGELGELYSDVDTVLNKYNVRRPDVLFFSRDRLHLIGKKAMEGPPDLAIEVISPSSDRIDRKDKFRQYCKAGVEHYWIIDPAKKSLHAFRLEGDVYVEAGAGQSADIVNLPPFKDLAIPLAKLWRRES